MNRRLRHSKAHFGCDLEPISKLEHAFSQALEAKTFSGASLLIGTPDEILLQKSWGATRTNGLSVDGHTRFDLASLTKPLVTAILCLWAISSGRFNLDDRIDRFCPASLVPSSKKEITLRYLLSHSSGLPAYQPYYLKLITLPASERPSQLLNWILQAPLQSHPGRQTCYSDLGFLLLGIMIEMSLDSSLDQLADQVIFSPLATSELEFLRLATSKDPVQAPGVDRQRPYPFAATEHCPWRRRVLQGEVHDENAYCLGGVAAHAGLFGTAAGIYHLLAHIWGIYRFGHEGLISADLLRIFWQRQSKDTESGWALGFDTPNRRASSAGRHFTPHSIGHLGFTGTSFWMDLEQEVLIVLLTNRVYPTRQNEKIREFRPFIHDLSMEAFYELKRD
jgi:serine-type D-Ala-D-Ala carboxypeptidase